MKIFKQDLLYLQNWFLEEKKTGTDLVRPGTGSKDRAFYMENRLGVFGWDRTGYKKKILDRDHLCQARDRFLAISLNLEGPILRAFTVKQRSKKPGQGPTQVGPGQKPFPTISF